ncbi:MAG: M24 family metallopeptidase [Desulfovibrionaceae bacterium]
MFEPLAAIPKEELARRKAECLAFLSELQPDAGGLLVLSRLSIYYFTGTLLPGVLWLPRNGENVLMLRKGLERAQLEAGGCRLAAFRSFSKLAAICKDMDSPLTEVLAAETTGATWQLGEMLASRLTGVSIVPGDMAISKAMARKSEWELEIMRLCGARHGEGLENIIPSKIRPGMSEREIAIICWESFYSLGHAGPLRMNAAGEECFLGHVSAGDSGNYPSGFNGPLGLRGGHPATPFMGYAGKLWKSAQPLALDIGFSLEGYCTDKTQVYWPGPASSIPDNVRKAHDFCMEIEAGLSDMMKPGTTPAEMWEFCLDTAQNRSMTEGFMGLGGNKVPFAGHGIGLVVDGWPALAKGFDEPLEAGMCLAVEPKFGIPDLGMVGVENTFEVTENGGRIITGCAGEIICIE